MPWHPVLVHYPIALTIMAAVFQLFAVLGRRTGFFLPALVCLCAAGVAGITAAITGAAQEQLVKELPGIHAALERHETLGNLSAWTLGAGGLLSIYLYLKGQLRPRLFLLALVLAGTLVLVTGHYGGRLVYSHGAGVSLPVPGEPEPVR